jgi:hypothetical protein
VSRPPEFEVTAEQFAALMARERGEQEFQEQYREEICTSRVKISVFSAIICTCPPWHRAGAIADMQSCAVHGKYIIDNEGKVI